jgi:hypothetical protein
LNSATETDSYPLPKQSDILHALTGADWLIQTALDVLAGFKQLELTGVPAGNGHVLGLMVYYSAFVPLYTWIVEPLFRLLSMRKEAAKHAISVAPFCQQNL